MSTADYCEVTWSPTRQAAIVRMTVDEIPYDETDEAAHQLLACGNLARRINTPPAKRGVDNPVGPVTTVTVASTGPFADDPYVCANCSHVAGIHAGAPVAGMDGTHCRVLACTCGKYVEP